MIQVISIKTAKIARKGKYPIVVLEALELVLITAGLLLVRVR